MTTYSDIGLKVSNIVPDLIQKYHLQERQRGVVVTAVEPGSIVAQVGMREGDTILKIDRKEVTSVEEFENIIGKIKPSDNVMFYLRRGNANLFVAFQMPSK